MSKNKRKLSAAQRDKNNILRAKILKEAGIISKQAKLHSGKFISKSVLKKVREYEHSADLGYKAVKVSKSVAKAAKERGFQVVQGNKIIGPATHQFRNRLKKGQLTGVRPVKGGMMEEVILPHTVYDLHTLVKQLEEGIDTLKMPDEQFAFRYHGNESYRAFMNSEDLLQYLRNYKGMFDITGSLKPEDLTEEYDAFSIFRLHPNDINRNIRGPRQRELDKRKKRMEAIARGEYVGKPRRRKSQAERLANMNPDRAARERKKLNEAAKQRKAKMLADPVKAAREKEAARLRAKASRDKKRGK